MMCTTREQPFQAVISDMDGVLTRTASLHERAWKRLFDDFLGHYPEQRPFSSADYRAHVDGKPRYQGIADFLASRGLDLPYGQPSDDPEELTICGLGNRKNRYFLETLDQGGVEVFEDAVAALERWRRGGLKLAIVSSSKNCRRVLRAVHLEQRVDVIVGGQLAEELGLPGKPEIMMEAARRLGVVPADAVILEDATAGVRAGIEDGFGLVVGVARAGNQRDLREAGAHAVVESVYRVCFPRRVPSALDHLGELAAWRDGRPLAVFLDYDGTLAPIVDHPRDAWMPDDMRSALSELAARCPVAIISGRDRPDVEARVGIDGLFYAGNHGFDISGMGQKRTVPEAERVLGDVDLAQRELEARLGRLSGVLIERKRYSVAVHYRLVHSPCVVSQVEQAVESVRARTGLRRLAGKKVYELEPAVDWDKGRALQWLIDVLPDVDLERSFVIYIGDDLTDENAFAALQGNGAGVRVGDEVTTSLADYRVADPGEVRQLLRELART